MSQAYLGMDPEAVRAMAAQMSAGAQQIRDLAAQIGSQVESAPWTGADREKFVSEWQGNHMAALTQVSEAIEQAAQVANQNADQQEQTSNS